jgi:hypothetical protein
MQSYDNLKTVVDAIFVGKERRFNRRFLALANHYLFEAIACTPESGWEKGQVENQVGNVREWLFTPTPRFSDFAELNTWLASRCKELAGRRHPEQTGRTIADCFLEEQPLLLPIKAVFDGYVEKTLRVSSTCLVKVDHNRYSVPAEWANRVVSLRLTADRLRLVADGQVIAEHERCYGRNQLLCDPWHVCPLGIICRYWRKSRGLCGMAHRSGSGIYRHPSGSSRTASSNRTRATGPLSNSC